MNTKEEILLFEKVKRILKEGYGADCETKDTDDFQQHFKDSNSLKSLYPRCASCRAKETIQFIEDHISLIKE